ncbi:MAG: RNA-guided endonuclease InsQ/TnpB family protein [Anaeroplasmataceae bacterium]
MYTYKVMIHPNNKQETKIRRTLNKCIECNNIIYDYLDSFVKNKQLLPNIRDVRKWFTVQKSIKDNEVLLKREGLTKKEMIANHLDTLFYDVSNDALKQEVKNTYNSFVRYFKKLSGYPVKKEYQAYKKSFYVDPYKIEFTDRKVKLEKIANNQKENRRVLNLISLAEKNRIPTNATYYNPRVVLEGDKFYIVVSVDDEFAPKKKKEINKDKTIGIDVNIKSIVTSDNIVYETVTKTKNYKKANKQFKRAQRKMSKRYELSKSLNKELRYSKNYQKIKRKWRKYKDRLLHLRDDHITRIINDIDELSPYKICVESLDVNSMKKREKGKRKTIAQGIQENPFRKFLKTLEERLKKIGIQIIYADKWYPSSKKCSQCGYIKDNLKLSDRIFLCPKCNIKLNRDYNAAINLNKYIKTNC